MREEMNMEEEMALYSVNKNRRMDGRFPEWLA
jgi:hypothetical protein